MARYTRKRYSGSGGGGCTSKHCTEVEELGKELLEKGSKGSKGANAANTVNAANAVPNWKSKSKVGTKKASAVSATSNINKEINKIQGIIEKLQKELDSAVSEGREALEKAKTATSEKAHEMYHKRAVDMFVRIKKKKAYIQKYETMIHLLSSKSRQRASNGGGSKKRSSCFGGLCGKNAVEEPVVLPKPVAPVTNESRKQRERRERREAWLKKKMAGSKYSDLPNNTRRAIFITNWHQKVVRGTTHENSNDENTYAEMEREFGNA